MAGLDTVIWVFAGGAIGGAARYLLSKLPFGTLIANTAACWLLGQVMRTGTGTDSTQYLLLGAGLAGALSTWSTLAGELQAKIAGGKWLRASGYLLAQVVCGLVAFGA
ncbi:CrcB family protein [Corynebacterium kozikiae]|uniref:CrcB family protein n=1 Tax=Corynebacterium kozikiae TaxID=2968469 RepID=UPI00211BB9FB|nr:CrcB family protein [Corynebacterium sp. 76QC2CO]MCQ9344243.1 CrcB family protein [Corynebacterium sp. 76QC2CO]